MYPKRQTFLVFGLSRSGKASAEFLLEKGANVYIYDDKTGERMETLLKELERIGAKSLKKEDLGEMVQNCDALVISPGIPIDHPLAVAFKRNNKAVIGESELASRYMRCPILAITGTNGKTTTVSMLTQVLQKGGYSAKSCGNIGAPMLNFRDMTEEEIAVAEISSFQLETLRSLQPHIAVVLNITEDHLNRHYNMENYIFLKKKILKNLTKAEYAVLNYDDPITRAFAENSKCNVLYFSIKERVFGAYYEKGDLYFGKEKIMSAKDLPADGLHNIQNALAVIVCAKIMGVKTEDIAVGLSEFKGIEHRIQKIAEIDGISFIDDSKGTNIDATIKAVETMKTDTILLLGGKDKGYDYKKLFQVLKNSRVVHAILYGENRYSLLKNAREENFENITLCDKFSFAVKIASLKAQMGQTVLLSPASASFDEFASYEERGEKFVELVQEFVAEREKGKGSQSSQETTPVQAQDDGENENGYNGLETDLSNRRTDEDEDE